MARTLDQNDLEILREFRRAESALISPKGFQHWMRDTGLMDFVHPPAAHHALMMEEFRWWLETPGAKLQIWMPFGSAKSTYSSIQLPLYIWANNPAANVLCPANSMELAESFNRRRRDAVATPQFSRLSGVTVRDDMKGVKAFGNTGGGTLRATSMDSVVAGFRCDYLITDDPHSNFQQVESRKYRDEVYEFYTSMLRSRLVPGGRELICSTRFSADDLCGRLIKNEGDDWRVLRIPEVADQPDDPLGREIGERLWPEYLGIDRLLNRERDPRLWLGAYQQIPPAEDGSWLSADDIPIVESAPAGLNKFAAMDLALSVGKGDWSVIVNFGVDEHGDLYMTDMWREQKSIDDTAAALTRNCQETNPVEVLIDDDNASKVFKTYALDHFRRSGVFAPLTEMKTLGRDKETRAAAFRGFAKQGRVKMVRGNWNAAAMAEISGFPASAPNDDIVDCLSLAGRRMAKVSPGKIPVQRKPEEIKSAFTPDASGKLHTTQTFDELFEDNRTRYTGILRI